MEVYFREISKYFLMCQNRTTLSGLEKVFITN